MHTKARNLEEAVSMFAIEYLVFVCEKKNFTQHPTRKRVHHVSMTKHAVHFRKMGLGSDELFNPFDFYVPSP